MEKRICGICKKEAEVTEFNDCHDFMCDECDESYVLSHMKKDDRRVLIEHARSRCLGHYLYFSVSQGSVHSQQNEAAFLWEPGPSAESELQVYFDPNITRTQALRSLVSLIEEIKSLPELPIANQLKLAAEQAEQGNDIPF